jgi:ATP-dependent DNA ligase
MVRRGNLFNDQFPTVAEACEHLPPDTLLDVELITLDKDGRVSFNVLQHHRSQAQAILFYENSNPSHWNVRYARVRLS